MTASRLAGRVSDFSSKRSLEEVLWKTALLKTRQQALRTVPPHPAPLPSFLLPPSLPFFHQEREALLAQREHKPIIHPFHSLSLRAPCSAVMDAFPSCCFLDSPLQQNSSNQGLKKTSPLGLNPQAPSRDPPSTHSKALLPCTLTKIPRSF